MSPSASPDAHGVRPLVLLRHGQSTANAEDSFSGWLDVPLTDRGKTEAGRAAELLASHGLLPDVAHTSVLSRAIVTLEIVLAVLDRRWVPARRSWRLNERHYGALQGRAKTAVHAEAGDELFTRWRRSYDAARLRWDLLTPPTLATTRVTPHCRLPSYPQARHSSMFAPGWCRIGRTL
jgi:bisphosphoglycerate-dependent phosphoglycerate mutase family 1